MNLEREDILKTAYEVESLIRQRYDRYDLTWAAFSQIANHLLKTIDKEENLSHPHMGCFKAVPTEHPTDVMYTGKYYMED